MQLTQDAAKKKNEREELEDEIDRLRDRLQSPSENYQHEVNKCITLSIGRATETIQLS